MQQPTLLIDINKVSPFEVVPQRHYLLGETREVPNGSKIIRPDGAEAPETYLHIKAVGPEVKNYKVGDMVHAKLSSPDVDGHGILHCGVKMFLFAESCITARLVEPVES